jgi:hypothetical protein
MNERIRLLVEQATTHIDPIAHDGACWNFDKEKFAVLIVVACGEFCGQVDRDSMFKHFEVES